MGRLRLASWQVVLAVFVSVIGLSLGYGWWQDQQREKADAQLGLDSARTISETFAKARSLQVATLRGEVIAIGRDGGWRGMLPSSVTVKYPYSVNYIVNLQGIDRSDFRWNAQSRTMTVVIPDVVPQPPTIDVARAAFTDTNGLFISRAASQRTIRLAGARAQQRAQISAAKPEHIASARASAREAMQALVTAPLRAANLGQVNVVVRFSSEVDGQRSVVDGSTPIEEIMRR